MEGVAAAEAVGAYAALSVLYSLVSMLFTSVSISTEQLAGRESDEDLREQHGTCSGHGFPRSQAIGASAAVANDAKEAAAASR